ncbi:hypothetical protein D3C75_1036690 [compost metagenome]
MRDSSRLPLSICTCSLRLRSVWVPRSSQLLACRFFWARELRLVVALMSCWLSWWLISCSFCTSGLSSVATSSPVCSAVFSVSPRRLALLCSCRACSFCSSWARRALW